VRDGGNDAALSPSGMCIAGMQSSGRQISADSNDTTRKEGYQKRPSATPPAWFRSVAVTDQTNEDVDAYIQVR